MKCIKCDCCGKEAKEYHQTKERHVKVEGYGNIKYTDLCNECFDKIKKVIENIKCQ